MKTYVYLIKLCLDTYSFVGLIGNEQILKKIKAML